MEYIILFICMSFISICNEIILDIGAIAYLVPLFFSILFLDYFLKIMIKNIFSYIFYLILSFFGSTHLQAFAGCLVVSTYYIFVFYKKIQKNFII